MTAIDEKALEAAVEAMRVRLGPIVGTPEYIARHAERLKDQREEAARGHAVTAITAYLSALPERELLAEALEAFAHINAAIDNLWNHPDLRHVRADIPESIKLNISKGQMMSRAAADKIRDAMGGGNE